MSEKQAKRLRRARRADINSNRVGPPHTGVLVRQVIKAWPALNHKQRGAVSFELLNGGSYSLVRAARRANA